MKRKAKILFVQKDSANQFFVLLGKRQSANESFWWIPGGSVEAGETDFQGGLRELDEELFLTPVYIHALQKFVQAATVPVAIEYQSSQAHNIIFFVVLPETTIQPIPGIRDEFDEISWFNVDTLPANMSREFTFIEKEFADKIKQL